MPFLSAIAVVTALLALAPVDSGPRGFVAGFFPDILAPAQACLSTEMCFSEDMSLDVLMTNLPPHWKIRWTMDGWYHPVAMIRDGRGKQVFRVHFGGGSISLLSKDIRLVPGIGPKQTLRSAMQSSVVALCSAHAGHPDSGPWADLSTGVSWFPVLQAGVVTAELDCPSSFWHSFDDTVWANDSPDIRQSLCRLLAAKGCKIASRRVSSSTSLTGEESLSNLISEGCSVLRTCRVEGRCTYSTSRGVCGPADDADCRGSSDCKRRGLCRFDKDDVSCAAGPSSADCHKDTGCSWRGECTWNGSSCAPGDLSDCKRSRDCRSDGRCSIGKDGVCAALHDDDCAASAGCRKYGMCLADGGRCLTFQQVSDQDKPD